MELMKEIKQELVKDIERKNIIKLIDWIEECPFPATSFHMSCLVQYIDNAYNVVADRLPNDLNITDITIDSFGFKHFTVYSRQHSVNIHFGERQIL